MTPPFFKSRSAGLLARTTKPMRLASLLVCSCYMMAGQAFSASLVEVMADRAKVVQIDGEPSTVVVGNPMFADVTVQQGHIIVHGKQFGSTNILVLSSEGEQIAEFDVIVGSGGMKNVSIYKAGSRFSYNCAPDCEGRLEVGDNKEYFDAILSKQIGAKVEISTNSVAE